ncbi:TIGR03749 family integrating conjugative element protein, partial [Escherichia coli]
MMMSLSVLSLTAQADELMKWERIPLNIPLKVGQERVIFADKNVRVGFPPALNGKLRVQSTGGAVYLKADSAFPQTRVQLQDVESGEMILLDVTAGEKGTTEPVRIVYDGDVSTVSRA